MNIVVVPECAENSNKPLSPQLDTRRVFSEQSQSSKYLVTAFARFTSPGLASPLDNNPWKSKLVGDPSLNSKTKSVLLALDNKHSGTNKI